MGRLSIVFFAVLLLLTAACSSSNENTGGDAGTDGRMMDGTMRGPDTGGQDTGGQDTGGHHDGSKDAKGPGDSGGGGDTGTGRGDAGDCTLDKTFGSGGTAFSAFPDGGTAFTAALLQGESVIALANSNYPTHATLVTKYEINGTVDPTFNSGAPVSINFGTGTLEYLSGAFAQSDGKIIVYGFSFSGGYSYDLVARIKTDGTLDTSFGTGGMVVNLPPYQDPSTPAGRLFAGMELSDDSLMFGGSNASGEESWFLMKLDSSGTLVPSFGAGGFADQSATTTASPQGILPAPSGQIMLFGTIFDSVMSQYVSRWGAERYSSTGALDTTFGTAGLFKMDVGVGTGGSGVGAAHLDTTNRLTLASGGSTDAGAFFAAGRLNSVGDLDFAFNSGALQTIPLGSGTSYVSVLLTDSSDRFILAGLSPKKGATIVRLNSDGSLDSLCGNHGVATAPITITGSVVGALDSEGRLLLAGQGTKASATGMWFARLWM